jgi:3D (Asp-Asp-Asp) domain-containing protein
MTAAGTKVRPGVVAADPDLLPMGSRIAIKGIDAYDGVYTVMDTGPKVRGRRIDLYMKDCRRAVKFGRRSVEVRLVQKP